MSKGSGQHPVSVVPSLVRKASEARHSLLMRWPGQTGWRAGLLRTAIFTGNQARTWKSESVTALLHLQESTANPVMENRSQVSDSMCGSCETISSARGVNPTLFTSRVRVATRDGWSAGGLEDEPDKRTGTGSNPVGTREGVGCKFYVFRIFRRPRIRPTVCGCLPRVGSKTVQPRTRTLSATSDLDLGGRRSVVMHAAAVRDICRMAGRCRKLSVP